MKNKVIFFFVLLLIFVIFHNWFSLGLIASGDFGFNFKNQFQNYSIFQYAWSIYQEVGLGGNASPSLWIILNASFPVVLLGQMFHSPWVLIERISYFFPFLILSFFSSFLISKLIVSNGWRFLASAIFMTNTYILMVVGGSQVQIALSYALSPIIFYLVINLINFGFEKIILNKFLILKSISLGIILALQIIFDPRIVYISLFGTCIYLLLKFFESRKIKSFFISLAVAFVIPGITSFLFNAFWLLPTILLRENPLQQLGSAYTTTNAVQYFSFAKFENTISLLHPNWPENIFGKVGFMKPEFLLLPILAYASLLFIYKTKDLRLKNNILFFALLGLIGAFLAKGTNDPFGSIYLWLFSYFPGFIMFRDSTKWYSLVAVSYSVLIPFSIWKIYERFKSLSKFQILNFKFYINFKNKILNLQNIFLVVTILYLLFLIKPALLGQLTGTFKTTSVPNDYIKLENFLYQQNSFSRTLWVPTTQRFGFYSNSHPEISAENFFNPYNDKNLIQKIASSESLLQNSGVKYVIVPYDSQGEIFLSGRKYSNSLYVQTIKDVGSISWLKPVSGFGKIAVFEVPNPKPHFFLQDPKSKIEYRSLSPVDYKVELKDVKKGDILVFSESYDRGWEAKGSSYTLNAKRYTLFNSFILPQSGSYSLDVYYTPQDLVNKGVVISLVSLITVLGYLLWRFKIKK